jgi:ribonucleoside-triphosphate reductase
MENRIEEIESEISELKKKMNQVEGSTTEVYSRIVGYYRSVKNWNLGKKEEYKIRVPFTKIDSKTTKPILKELSPATETVVGSPLRIAKYNYFYRSSCPNCPAMKDVLDKISISGETFNVDMEKGLEEASKNLVFSAPTVIFRSAEGSEVFRTGNPSEVLSLFNLESVTA